MKIEEPSEPQNLQMRCPNCRKPLPVSIADLRENKEIKCRFCDHPFTPNIDVEILLKLIKQTEDARLDSELIM